MKPKVVVLVIIGIVILFAVSRLFSPKPDVQPPQAPARTVEKAWEEYVSPSKRFTVNLPEMPQRVAGIRPMPSATEEIQYDTSLAMTKSGTVLMINVIDYPPSVDVTDSKSILKAAVDEILGSNPTNQMLKNENGVSLGYPSMDFTISNKDATVVGRAILKGHALFVLTVADRDPHVALSVFTKMVDSFRVTE